MWKAGVGVSAAAVLAVSGAAVFVLQGTRAWVGWEPVLLAMAIIGFVPVVGLWPLGRCDPSDSKRISKAAYSGTPIRMVTAGVLGLVVILSLADRPGRMAFGVWLGGLYVVSLLAETVVLAVWLHSRGGVTRV